MEILAAAILWPLIILVVGLVLVSLSNLSFFFFPPAFFLLIFLLGSMKIKEGAGTEAQLENLRRILVIFSIAILLPIFMRYVMDLSGKPLPIIIAGLFLGFSIVIWGIFTHNHRVLAYSNILGGAFIVIYLYSELWSLGQLPRIIAAAFGLLMAVVVSVIKLKDKLT